jgi:hypothetical protein
VKDSEHALQDKLNGIYSMINKEKSLHTSEITKLQFKVLTLQEQLSKAFQENESFVSKTVLRKEEELGHNTDIEQLELKIQDLMLM